MEKYKKFTDAGTGINPFVPFQPKNTARSSSALGLARSILVSPLLFAIRFSLLALCTLFALTLSKFLPGVKRWIDVLYSHVALVLLGFFHVNTEYMLSSGRRRELSTTEIISKQLSHGYQSGDLILANHMSFVEVLYLARFSPVMFAAPVRTAGQQQVEVSRVVRRTFMQYLFDVLQQRLPFASSDVEVASSQAQELKDLLAWAKQNNAGPVVLFPEATTSNGLAILQWQRALFSYDFDEFIKKNKMRVHIAGFKLDFERFSPAYVVPGLWRHLYGLMTQIYNNMSARIVENVLEEQKSQPAKEFEVEEMRTLMSKCFRLKLVQRSLPDKVAFTDYWNKTQQSGYVE